MLTETRIRKFQTPGKTTLIGDQRNLFLKLYPNGLRGKKAAAEGVSFSVVPRLGVLRQAAFELDHKSINS